MSNPALQAPPTPGDSPLARGRHTLVVGQAGGPTPVINSSLAGVVQAAQEAGFRRVFGLRYGVRGLLDGQYRDLSGLSAADLESLAATPSSALGACRLKLQPNEVA